MDHGTRRDEDVVACRHVVDQEHALPRHEHVLEEHDRVHLLETRRKGGVEAGLALVVAVAAEEAHPGSRGRERECERVRGGRRVVLQDRRREYEDLVAERPERREQPGAADDDAPRVALDRVERNLRARDARGGESSVDLGVYERVREHEIVVAHVVVVAPHVVAELGADRREEVRRRGERHERGVQIVAGAAQHAAALDRPVVHCHAALLEMVGRGRA
jgi:hypothetical protein